MSQFFSGIGGGKGGAAADNERARIVPLRDGVAMSGSTVGSGELTCFATHVALSGGGSNQVGVCALCVLCCWFCA
jgi:hypothetical protein